MSFVHKKKEFGMHEGKRIWKYIVKNERGMELSMTNFGATLLSLKVPDRKKNIEEVNLQFTDFTDLQTRNASYYGATVGRFANRIANGSFSLYGKQYILAVNNGPNSLHGGIIGWNQRVWDVTYIEDDDFIGFEFRLISPDKDEGYPGEMKVTTVYKIHKYKTILRINFNAQTDAPTIINMCNHAYWNLSGNFKRNIFDHSLSMNATHYLPVNEFQIPTGEIKAVKDSHMDFTKEMKIGKRLSEVDGGGVPGYDHCYIIGAGDPEVHETSMMSHVATLKDTISGRVMKVMSTQPGVQLYSGNFITGESSPHTQYNAVCLETQHFPDSPNQPSFPSTVLHPGEVYNHTTDHIFSVEPENK